MQSSSLIWHLCVSPLRRFSRKWWTVFRRVGCSRIDSLDRNGLLKHPVSKTEVPDYYEVVKKPMTWDTIDAKLDRYEYWDFEAFKVSYGDGTYSICDPIVFRVTSSSCCPTRSSTTSLGRHFTRLPNECKPPFPPSLKTWLR